MVVGATLVANLKYEGETYSLLRRTKSHGMPNTGIGVDEQHDMEKNAAD